MPAIIEGYNYDIFISYRQNDNRYDGWVTEFVDHLRAELKATFKEEISVYFDLNQHDGLLDTHDVDESLKEKLNCLIFIPIISRTYCDPKSFAWEHEFREFKKQASNDQFGLKVKLPSGNVASRILPVQIHDLDPEDKALIEDELGGMLRCIEFVYRSAGVNRPLRASEDHPQDNLNKTYYRDQINKAANAVREIINALKKQDHPEAGKTISVPQPVHDRVRIRKPVIIIASASVLILVILGVFIIPGLFRSSKPIERSIAVLPFRNLSNDTAQIYFCDGFREELLSNLQKVNSLDVRSRTSSDQYRNTDKSVIAIGRELDVNYLVEGSVGFEGNNLKIWVQLIDARSDKHLWSDEYMRELTIEQIFSLQSEISKSIAAELKAVLTPEEIEKIERRPTENLEAYNLYLQGNYYYWRSYDSQDYEKAIELYERVIKTDPDFALAYTKLAMSYLSEFWFYHDRSDEVLLKSRQYIERAFKLEPELPEAHLALGFYYYCGFNDYPRAAEQLELVLKEQPDNAEALYYQGCVHRRAGNWSMSREYLTKASKLEPKSARINFNAGETYNLLRLYPDALRYYNTALANNPEWTYAYKDVADVYIKMDGNTTGAKEFLDNSAIKNTAFEKDSLTLEILVLVQIYDGKYEEAMKILTRSRFDIFESQFYYRPKYLYYAQIYDLMNKPELEHAYFDSTRMLIERRLIDYPDDQRLYSTLGIAYAGLGLGQKAIAAGEKAVRIMPVEKEAWKGVYLIEDMAYIYVLLGNYPEAMKKLDYLLSIPGPLSVKILELDPKWAPLKNQQGFKEMLGKHKAN